MRDLLFTTLLLIGIASWGQEKYKPTIVVLDPFQTNYDTTLLTEIHEYTYQYSFTPQEETHILDSLNDNLQQNIRVMNIAEFHYRKQRNFAVNFSFTLSTMLTYMVFGKTENCIVIPSHDKSNGSIESLKAISRKHDVQWVVNPIRLTTHIKDGAKFSTARIQIFNFKKNKIVLDKEYTGGTNNPGFELSCDTGSLDCTVNNIVDLALHDILLTILKSYQH